ncbi:MAG TPA: alpha/beta fold hydrolase [Verrucomicrobiae bacterium]|nr:alpha/beta fold hydrolase [Verrucomicrobiae bacterium]
MKILAVLYLVLVVLVFLAQRRLLYHPDGAPLDILAKLAAGSGFQPWQNSSGEVIGWKQLARANLAHERVLIVHGNAGSAVDRMDFAEALRNAGTFDVYILEYPGYGARPGKPTQENFFRAADEAFELLKKDGQVYLIGESLGTGVAAYLAGTHPAMISGVLLIAPYDNMVDVAQFHMPIFPVRLLLRDRFPSSGYLKNYNGPVGVLLAGQDVVVPSRFGRKLYDNYSGPKKLWEMPHAGHNDLSMQSAAWWKELGDFWTLGPRLSRP